MVSTGVRLNDTNHLSLHRNEANHRAPTISANTWDSEHGIKPAGAPSDLGKNLDFFLGKIWIESFPLFSGGIHAHSFDNDCLKIGILDRVSFRVQ